MLVISDLFGLYVDRPILVIGGGPSVAEDLPKLVDLRPALVLSANEHGCKQDFFRVDYIVHCDKVHCMKRTPEGRTIPMAPHLREYGKPLISRWSTADVRLEDWRFTGNSGTTAVAVAAALGGSPIVVTGLDFWATGRRYFHDGTQAPRERRRINGGPVVQHPDRRLNALAQFVEHAHVRPMSGLLATRWPLYDPAERFQPAPVIPYTAKLNPSTEYRAVRSFHWSNYDTVPADTVLKLTKSEAAPLLQTGKIAPVVSPA
jgi:hypothetical protein